VVEGVGPEFKPQYLKKKIKTKQNKNPGIQINYLQASKRIK
jgi:hypothetical protein